MSEEEQKEIEKSERDPVEEPAEENTKQVAEELKVVIILKGTRVMIGVQSPDCDPIFSTLEGELVTALSQVPQLVDNARATWDAHPRYPKADLPEPPPSPTPARNQPPEPKTKPKQPSFF